MLRSAIAVGTVNRRGMGSPGNTTTLLILSGNTAPIHTTEVFVSVISDAALEKLPMSYASVLWNVAKDAMAKCHCYGHLCGHCDDARVVLAAIKHIHSHSEVNDICAVCGEDLRHEIHVRSGECFYHAWGIAPGDWDSAPGTLRVVCRICQVPGEQNERTGKVFYPAT